MKNYLEIALTSAIYGALVMFGGLYGYFVAGSSISLFTSVPAAAALFIAALMTWRGDNRGHYLALGVVAVLTVVFQVRFIATGGFFPSGFMTLVSALTIVVLAVYRPR